MKFSLGKKTTLGVIIIALVLGFAAIIFSYNTYWRTMDAHYKTLGMNILKTAASQMDPETLKTYFETGEKDAEYEKTYALLCDIRENNDVMYLYVVRPTEEGAYYIFDTDPTEEAYDLGSFEEYYEGAFTDNLSLFLAGEPMAPIISNEEFGWLMSVFYPVLDSEGNMAAYVCADISVDQVMADRHEFLVNIIAILAVITAAIAGIMLLFIRRNIVTPINRLSRAAAAFVSEEEQNIEAASSISALDIRTGDEIENLSLSIKQMDRDIHKYIENLTAVTAEKERIGAELSVAANIQASMLPCIFPPFPERTEFDIYAVMKPAKEVGGDFYDFFLIDEDHLAVVIADVSGKGVPAALFMVITKTIIQNHSMLGKSPEEVFTAVNGQLCENNDAGMFVTAWMGVLEISTGRLTYVNAGHNPPILKKAGGSAEWVRTRPGFVLAGLEGIRYVKNEMTLEEGDVLFLYTDGVTEALDPGLALYGESRLEKVLAEAVTENRPVSKLLETAWESLEAFAAGADQADDITMLGLKINGKG